MHSMIARDLHYVNGTEKGLHIIDVPRMNLLPKIAVVW